MKITAVFVSSLDGKITQGNDSDIYTWTSKEDGEHFFSLLKNFNLIIMGRKTYEAAREKIKLSKEKLRVVLTKNPREYKSLVGMLEFTNNTIENTVADLEKRGYTDALFVGGSELFYKLLEQKLVSTVYLTLEPYFFGIGVPLISSKKAIDVSLTLIEAKKINEKGTLLLKYTVNK